MDVAREPAAGEPTWPLDVADQARVESVQAGLLPPQLTLAASVVPPAVVPGQRLRLTDTEGAPLVAMTVQERSPLGVTGRLDLPDRRPPDGPAVGSALTMGGWPPRLERVVELASRQVVCLAQLGGGWDLDDPRRWRADAAWAQLAAASGLPLLRLPLPWQASPRQRAVAAARLRAAALVVPPDGAGGLPPGLSALPVDLGEAVPWWCPGSAVMLTGFSGAGKSTIARALVARLGASGGRTVSLLDGDIVRTHLSAGLGFGRVDRDTNVLRIAWVAAQVVKHGGIAVCAPIAPYDATRRAARALVESYGGPDSFCLVHVATPLAECERRDRKGLYARARAGELAQFTGVDDPYEPPADAAVVVDATQVRAEDAAGAILAELRRQGRLGQTETFSSLPR